jgi:vitamin B12 transporter
VNIDATLRKGAEAELELRPLPGFELRIAYAYIDAANRFTDLPLLRQPKHAVSVNADWRASERFSLGASVRYSGEALDGGGLIDAYTRVDLRASYAASKRLELYGRIENAFDTHYQSVLGYGEPGLSVFAGVRLKL